MSLPSPYVEEIEKLNQLVATQHPADVLQFCANYFNGRLESERAERFPQSHPHSPPMSNPFAGTQSETTFPGTLGGFGMGISSPFDGAKDSIREEDEELGSPTSPTFRPHEREKSSSSRRSRRHGSKSPSGHKHRSPFHHHRAAESGSFVGSHLSPQSAQGDFPNNYNRNRRTSVSAESLVPSSSDDDWTPPIHPKTQEQMERLKGAVSANFLFSHLDEEASSRALLALVEKPVPAKDTRIITQGDVGDYFYVVEKGDFDIYVNDVGTMTPGPNGMGKKVASIGPGGSFGELALMYNAPRAATVISTTPHNVVWALDRVTFRRILLQGALARRKMYEAFLEEITILSSLLAYERAKIADALETATYEPGEIIIREGDPGDKFYFIESGVAEVIKKAEGLVRTLSKGDYFGELALLNDAPRAASIRAQTKVKVAFLGKDGFQRLLGPVVEIMRRNDPRLTESVDPLMAPHAMASGDSVTSQAVEV
ncbi:BcPKAR, component of the cAMP cascade : PKA regulatory subunit [Ascodesmis nigricans]|uniref:cAMP-dependent protein kinase regulatory subunit n=1 Tax=Ascodesmis nigricans TaxID=341454 RepID=A0A4S2N5X9_9PEZI|nr:BcPKAR, component of the cAMP cascade : PKA regulatory subunit [Ascodesmis nigricans]